MLKRIRNASEEDLEYVKSKSEKEIFANIRHFHKSGSLEMFQFLFKTIHDDDLSRQLLRGCVEELATNHNYPFLKYAVSIGESQVIPPNIPEDILFNCLPESANLIRHHKFIKSLSEDFIKEAISQNAIDQKNALALFGFSKECFAGCLSNSSTIELPKNSTIELHFLHSDSLRYLNVIRENLHSHVTVRVWDMKDLLEDLSVIPSLSLKFEIANPMSKEVYEKLKSLENLYSIINPYYLTQYPKIAKSEWDNADFSYFCESESINWDKSIMFMLDYRLTGKARFDALKIMAQRFADLKKHMGELTKDEEIFLAANHRSYLEIIFAYLHYPYISHTVAQANIYSSWFSVDVYLKHADLGLIGDSLRYIPFSKLQMKTLCRKYPELQIENGKLQVRRLRAKSARK